MNVLCLNVCMNLGVCFEKLHLIKVLLDRDCVIIRVIFGVRFERRKVDEKANLDEN